jgi:hypothetical protein
MDGEPDVVWEEQLDEVGVSLIALLLLSDEVSRGLVAEG